MGVTPREGSIPSSGTKQFNRLAALPGAANLPPKRPTAIETATESFLRTVYDSFIHRFLPHGRASDRRRSRPRLVRALAAAGLYSEDALDFATHRRCEPGGVLV